MCGKRNEMVRELRWSDGVFCPHCEGRQVVKNGHDNLSNQQIAAELNLSVTQAHQIAMQLRQGIVDRL